MVNVYNLKVFNLDLQFIVILLTGIYDRWIFYHNDHKVQIFYLLCGSPPAPPDFGVSSVERWRIRLAGLRILCDTLRLKNRSYIFVTWMILISNLQLNQSSWRDFQVHMFN